MLDATSTADGLDTEGEPRRFSTGDKAMIAVIITIALGFIAVAFAMSAAALYQAATWLEDTPIPINGGDLRFLFPIVLDGLILMLLSLDLWSEWKGIRHPAYRYTAWGLAALTLHLNMSSGSGSTDDLLGHAAPPLGVIIVSEIMSIWIRSLAGLSKGRVADRIPLGHWIARPASAARVARLMLGWHITSYGEAVEMDRRRCMAYSMLREQHGVWWRLRTPRHLKWMLANGTQLETAYELVRALTEGRVAMTAAEVRTMANGQEKKALPVGHSETGQPEPAASGQGDELATPVASGQDDGSALANGQTGQPDPVASGQGDELDSGHRSPGLTVIRTTEPSEKTQKVLALLRERPDLVSGPMGDLDAHIAQHLEVSVRTARRYRTEALAMLADEQQQEGQLATAAGGH